MRAAAHASGMLNFTWRCASLVGACLALAACGGGGGGGGGGQTYSISLSLPSASLNGITGGSPPSQQVMVTFNGAGVVVGTLPGQTAPSWLSVSAPAQVTSPATVVISASSNTQPGNYSTTLRFATGSASGSNVVYQDLPVTLTMVAGTEIFIDPNGVAQNSSVAVSLNNGAPQTVVHGQINTLGTYAVGSAYTLAVPAQPPGQTCTFPNGSATVTGTLGNDPLELSLYCNASLIPWTWVAGPQGIGQAAVYGTRLTPAAGNTPGARLPAAFASDAAGNLWLFGGGATTGGLNPASDLWRYDTVTGLWTWMSGSNAPNASGVYGMLGQASSANSPGARESAVAWVDANGNFWLFGGFGNGATTSGVLNDLWMYNVGADTWTWMGGASEANNATVGVYSTTPSTSNIPGGRWQATVAKDPSGAVWFFGGNGLGSGIAMGYMDDLWKFDPATGVWSWINGSDQPGAAAVQGMLGVSAPGNQPGPRALASAWVDGTGDLWVFGGTNPSNTFFVNDLWRFDPTTSEWTWMNGTDPASGFLGVGSYNAPGTTSTNVPSSRGYAAAWTDTSGNLWMFGGLAVTENFNQGAAPTNDLWKYTPSTNTWSWLSGSNAGGSPAIFGTQGVASATNVPSGREMAAAWTDPSGKLWLWGGTTGAGDLTDVWSVVPQ